MGEAAAKALAINPDLAFAQTLLGSASDFSWLLEIQGLERALRKEPGKTEVVEALVWDLLNVGYLQEALGVAERYVDRDPLLPAANYWYGECTLCSRAYQRSRRCMGTRGPARSHFSEAGLLARANLVDKRDDTAIAHY